MGGKGKHGMLRERGKVIFHRFHFIKIHPFQFIIILRIRCDLCVISAFFQIGKEHHFAQLHVNFFKTTISTFIYAFSLSQTLTFAKWS